MTLQRGRYPARLVGLALLLVASLLLTAACGKAKSQQQQAQDWMGGIVAYTGDPNPATAAKMTSQYRSAVQEWDTAIDTIWSAAGQDNPPDL